VEKEQSVYRFVTLDGLRGIAALCVMSMHMTTPTGHVFPLNAFLAVDLFFILSGFVLAHAYGNRILDNTMSFGGFVLRRAIRLYPLYILSIVLGIAIMLSVHSHSASTYSVPSILTSAFVNGGFLPYLNRDTLQIVGIKVPGMLFPANIAAWSLFFEMIGSIAFWGFIRLRFWALVLFAVASLVSLIFYGAWPFSHGLPAAFINVGFLSTNFAGGFFRVGYGMTLGVLLYRVFTSLDHRTESSSTLRRFARFSPLLYLAIVTTFGLSFPAYGGLYELLLVLIAAPAVVLLGAFTQPMGFLRSVEEWLGWLSYPIYCFHIPLIIMCYNGGLLTANTWSVLPCATVILLVSTLVGRYCDEPVRARLTRALVRRPAIQTASSLSRGA
jgi:peptidoglycan/LPS O-acetylase OafA/YrhL